MAKVTGIGGVFLKCKGDSKALAAWYQQHLGFSLESFGGAILKWPDDQAEDKDKSNHTAYADNHQTKKKYRLELELNYKKRLVAKYTKELITKLDMFE